MSFWFSPIRAYRGLAASCLLLVFVSSAAAQPFSVSGYVEDARSGERLAYASVYDDVQKIGTATNDYGFFRLTAAKGRHVLVLSYLGYTADTLSITIRQDTSIVVSLVSRVEQLQEIDVSGTRVGVEANMHVLTPAEISVLPAIGGEADVMKALQTLPGIRSGTEGMSGLYVRGGSPDQNLILLDGAPIYHAAHLFGFFSVFNPDAIQRVRILKGGFPARYGGRLSSVIDVDTKEGNLNERSARAGVSPIAARFLVEGPIQTGRSSFLLSGRRTYLDGLAKLFTPNGAVSLGAYFFDFNGKINHIFHPRADYTEASTPAATDTTGTAANESRAASKNPPAKESTGATLPLP